ncbi:MAG: putative metalloprotease CJM1_0395 family protein [Planctomycetota bacterium]
MVAVERVHAASWYTYRGHLVFKSATPGLSGGNDGKTASAGGTQGTSDSTAPYQVAQPVDGTGTPSPDAGQKQPGTDPAPADPAGNGQAGGDLPAQATASSANPAQATASSATGKKNDQAEETEIKQLEARDAHVRAHEAAHAAVGGPYVRGESFSYERGPDGRMYAIGGEVQLDVSPEKDPRATIRKMEVIRAAALAPGDPSPQDMAVAAEATAEEAQAAQELAQEANQKATGQASGAAAPSGVGGAQPGASSGVAPNAPTGTSSGAPSGVSPNAPTGTQSGAPSAVSPGAPTDAPLPGGPTPATNPTRKSGGAKGAATTTRAGGTPALPGGYSQAVKGAGGLTGPAYQTVYDSIAAMIKKTYSIGATSGNVSMSSHTATLESNRASRSFGELGALLDIRV